jgi:hypothetical protein
MDSGLRQRSASCPRVRRRSEGASLEIAACAGPYHNPFSECRRRFFMARCPLGRYRACSRTYALVYGATQISPVGRRVASTALVGRRDCQPLSACAIAPTYPKPMSRSLLSLINGALPGHVPFSRKGGYWNKHGQWRARLDRLCVSMTKRHCLCGVAISVSSVIC